MGGGKRLQKPTHRQAGAAAARVSDPRPNWVPILCDPPLFLESQRASGGPSSYPGPPLSLALPFIPDNPSTPIIPADPQP